MAKWCSAKQGRALVIIPRPAGVPSLAFLFHSSLAGSIRRIRSRGRSAWADIKSAGGKTLRVINSHMPPRLPTDLRVLAADRQRHEDASNDAFDAELRIVRELVGQARAHGGDVVWAMDANAELGSRHVQDGP